LNHNILEVNDHSNIKEQVKVNGISIVLIAIGSDAKSKESFEITSDANIMYDANRRSQKARA